MKSQERNVGSQLCGIRHERPVGVRGEKVGVVNRPVFVDWRTALGILLLVASALLHFLSEHENTRYQEKSDLPNTQRLVSFHNNAHENEEEIAARFVALNTTSVDRYLTVLQLREIAARDSSGKKLVALVELRNVERTVSTFLQSLSLWVDAIVVLDDHSSDSTRTVVMREALSGSPVDVLIKKSGAWIREELRDRQVLLNIGRYVNGTHFVLPDYDEFFSFNCVQGNVLRDRVLSLSPGESLYLPWIELWKSTSLHRVHCIDKSMNFLLRRQTIIFADDGSTQYDETTSNSRSLSNFTFRAESGHREGSIHALRCPRTICPQPIRYSGPNTPLTSDSKVKLLPDCRIIELRFLSIANVLLKTAWYEALGRVMNAPDGVTLGKVYQAMASSFTSVPPSHDIFVGQTQSEWLLTNISLNFAAFSDVEIWRVQEMLKWRSDHGRSRFSGLSVYGSIDFEALKQIADELHSRMQVPANIQNVPRKAHTGSFVVVFDFSKWNDGASLATLLEFFGGSVAKLSEEMLPTVQIIGSERLLEARYEEQRMRILMSVKNATEQSEGGFAYVSATSWSEDKKFSLVEFVVHEMTDTDVVFLVVLPVFGRTSSLSPNEMLFRKEIKESAALKSSNARVLEVEVQFLCSAAAMAHLFERMTGELLTRRVVSRDGRRASVAQRLLNFAEDSCRTLRGNLSRSDEQAQQRYPKVARLVFSLNTGRSGSKYLAALLNSVGPDGVISLHEPACPRNFCSGGGAIPMQNRSLAGSYQERAQVKLAMVRSEIANVAFGKRPRVYRANLDGTDGFIAEVDVLGELRRNPKCSQDKHVVLVEVSRRGYSAHCIDDTVYAESNPNFKSWFSDVVLDILPECGYEVDVVVLRKYLPAVVKSLYKTGYFTTRNGYNWMETANGVNAEIVPVDTDDHLDAYDKLISYALNAEAVTRKIMAKYSDRANFVEIRAERMYGKEGSLELLERLKLAPRKATLDIFGDKIDKYLAESHRTASLRKMRTSLRECSRRVTLYLERCRKLGIDLPDEMVQLHPEPGFMYPDE